MTTPINVVVEYTVEAIQLYRFTVSLVQWINRLLPAQRGSGSRPGDSLTLTMGPSCPVLLQFHGRHLCLSLPVWYRNVITRFCEDYIYCTFIDKSVSTRTRPIDTLKIPPEKEKENKPTENVTTEIKRDNRKMTM
jgi:hypothetical protein